MASPLSQLKPSLLWKHFGQILAIPHCSGNEKALGDYVISCAQSAHLNWKRDKTGNVVVEKKASAGYENAAGIILQGHMDMVCEKNSDVVHDFLKDPIIPEIEGDWVKARGTSLGSDNGIGLAACLAVMEDQSLAHGPLEFLFTVDEETGLTGANRIKKGFLRGSKMFNLDSEEEGTFTIGCAGGADSEIILPLERKKTRGENLMRLKIYGLRGGHSGLDIHQGRGSAIKIIARLLWQAQNAFKFSIIRMEGGSKRNAIPREAWADFYLQRSQSHPLASFLKKALDEIRKEYAAVEKELQLSLGQSDGEKEYPLSAQSQNTLIALLLSLPHGVMAMHPEIAGLVETSTNLAIVSCQKKHAQVICNTRSSIASALEAIRGMIKAVTHLAGAKITLLEGYPGWKPNLQSPLLMALTEVHKHVFGREPQVIAVHAGLECGILGEKFPGMDMISFGPTIQHPHSPEERVHIPSVENFWKFLTAALG